MSLKSSSECEDFKIKIIFGIPIVKINISRATLNETKEFKQVLDSVMSANYNKIIIDFTDCHFFDSAFVGVMVNALKKIKMTKGDILTITRAGSVNKIFIRTGLDKIFRQFDSIEHAIESFSI